MSASWRSPALPLLLLNSVLGWAGCMLTTATQICEGQEGHRRRESKRRHRRGKRDSGKEAQGI